MKKLMIALAAMIIGLGAQAATVSWSVSSVKLPGADGAYGSVSALAKVTMSVYLTDATTFAGAADSAGVLSAVSGKTADYSDKTNMSKLTLTSGDSYKAGDNVYAFVALSYTDDAGKSWAIGNKAQATIVESLGVAQNAVVDQLNTIGVEGVMQLLSPVLAARLVAMPPFQSRPLACSCSSALALSRFVAVVRKHFA